MPGPTWVGATRQLGPASIEGPRRLGGKDQTRSPLGSKELILNFNLGRKELMFKMLPSGLQPCSIMVSGHSQIPETGLKARPGRVHLSINA